MLHSPRSDRQRWQPIFHSAWLALPCVLMGCTVGPDFSPPSAPPPHSLVAQTPTETVLPFPTVHFQLRGKLISTTEKPIPRCSTENLR